MRRLIVIAPMLASLGLAGAVMADPIPSSRQCPAPWSDKVAAAQCRGETQSAAQQVDMRGQPRRLSKSDIKAELASIRLDNDANVSAPVLLSRN